MSRRFELLVFDWDGTLMDSAAEIVLAMQRAIQDLGLPERSADRMRELIGLGLDDVLRRLFPEMQTQKVRALLTAYRRRYTAPGGQSRPFPGVAETLSVLSETGYELAIATGKSRRGLDRNLSETGLGPFFRHSRCADESSPKPAPDMLEHLLLRSATEPERAVMIGDTEYDMAMAAAAGVTAIGVACGVHDSIRLREAGAVAVLEDVRALPAWLERVGDEDAGKARSARGRKGATDKR